MNDRERFVACLTGEPVDRPPYWLFWGPWATTLARWKREGLSELVMDHRTLFDSDHLPAGVPVNCGPCPRISPSHWEEFMGSPYRRIREFARSFGIPLISVDTDGDPDRIIPCMMRNGVNYLYPMEVAAGCDVGAIRTKYPTLGMMGGIDKRALAMGPGAIDRELERIRPAIDKGRYIPELDHLIPDDVSWENYCYYAEALKTLVGKTGQKPRRSDIV